MAFRCEKIEKLTADVAGSHERFVDNAVNTMPLAGKTLQMYCVFIKTTETPGMFPLLFTIIKCVTQKGGMKQPIVRESRVMA